MPGKLCVYVRSTSKKDTEFINKIMSAASITDWTIKDIGSSVGKQLDGVAAAFGSVTARLAVDLVDPSVKIFTLPSLGKLQPKPENKNSREEAWKVLKDIKNSMENSAEVQQKTSDGKEWDYVMLMISGKRVCIYNKDRPPVDAERFLSREDCKLLLKMKDAFRADRVVLEEEAIAKDTASGGESTRRSSESSDLVGGPGKHSEIYKSNLEGLEEKDSR